MMDTDIRAGSDFTQAERRRLKKKHEREEKLNIAIEAENVFKELELGNKTPEFADGKTAFCFTVRESIAQELYEELDHRFGDDSE